MKVILDLSSDLKSSKASAIYEKCLKNSFIGVEKLNFSRGRLFNLVRIFLIK